MTFARASRDVRPLPAPTRLTDSVEVPEERGTAMTIIGVDVTEIDGITAALRRAAVRATLAPSVHNTQPWHFVLRRDVLDIYADRSRQLLVLDPRARQLVISCGCALFNARTSLAAAGLAVRVERFPDPNDPDLLAELTVVGHHDPGDLERELDTAIEYRRTNRRRFLEGDVPDDLIELLVDVAAQEGALLFPIRDLEHRLVTTALSQHADRLEYADPAYRAELRAWTTDDPTRPDGVPAMAVPHVDSGSGDEVPLRDFDSHGLGWLPTRTESTAQQCMLLLGAESEDRRSWLRTGEALERILLELTRRDYVASPLTQVVEVAGTNQALRRELGLRMHPHVLLRVGRAPATPAVRRRRLVEVLTESRE